MVKKFSFTQSSDCTPSGCSFTWPTLEITLFISAYQALASSWGIKLHCFRVMSSSHFYFLVIIPFTITFFEPIITVDTSYPCHGSLTSRTIAWIKSKISPTLRFFVLLSYFWHSCKDCSWSFFQQNQTSLAIYWICCLQLL